MHPARVLLSVWILHFTPGPQSAVFIYTDRLTIKRVSMGLTDRRKTAKDLVDSRKNWKISTVSRK